MSAIVVPEIVCAVFMCIVLSYQFAEHGAVKSERILRINTAAIIIWLGVDAWSFATGMSWLPTFLADTWGNVVSLIFLIYCKSYISEKTPLKKWTFNIPEALCVVDILLAAILFSTGHIVGYENGVMTEVYGFPLFLLTMQTCCVLYPAIIAVIKGKNIGLKGVILFALFAVMPILGTAVSNWTESDYTVVLCAFAQMIIVVFLQNERRHEDLEEHLAHKILADNSTRFFALEDDFESLYDVDLETGHYVYYERGDFYRDNVSNRLVAPTDFFIDLNSNIKNVIYEEDIPALEEILDREAMLKKLAETDRIDHYYRIKTENGPAWLKLRVVYKDELKKNLIVGVFRAEAEIAARQQAGELNDVKRTLNMMFSLSDQFDPIIVLDPETGEYDWYQSKAEEIEEKTSMTIHGDDLYKNIGIDSASIIHEEDREQYKAFYTRENMLKIAETGESQETENRWKVGPDGTYLWKYNKAVRMIDESGKVHVVVGVVDTTEEKKNEERMKDTNARLEKALVAADAANKAKSNFLFNMSHDIRTPMNAIMGFTTMAKKSAGDREKIDEYLSKIDISGQQLLTLINQVLEMARIESGKVTFDNKPVNIREEFNSMETVIAEQAKERGLTFSAELGEVEHENVFADEARMSSIALNIIGNAMKYTPAGGRVTFGLKETASRKPGYATLVFTVTDTGIGMSEEYLKELYEPFSREQSSTVSKIQGTGLGMSIVKSIVDMVGGNIEVHSELGKGTRFDVTVDFEIDECDGTLYAENDVDINVFKGRRVLLVEDNEFNREIAKDFLDELGVKVETAEDGVQAVEKIQAIADRGEFHYYDFILMDVQMPNMNGYEATKAIRDIPGPDGVHIPIIAMTANAFEEDRQNALAAGMDEHLAKPIDSQKMIETIAKFLN